MQTPLWNTLTKEVCICKIDDIYVEKEEEYDHFNTSWQKHVAEQVDDDWYGSAFYFNEDSYSMLRQNKNIEPCSGNTTPYSENQCNCVPWRVQIMISYINRIKRRIGYNNTPNVIMQMIHRPVSCLRN